MTLYQYGVTDALARIQAGEFTAADYRASCVARAAEVEDAIRAFAFVDGEAILALRGPDDGRLGGMPVGIKDIIATKGMPTEMGSAAYRGHVPDRSASVIAALRRAGGIVFGKTVTTEFAWRHPGATRNPWSVAHTPGGSSSGSAAAVAAGCVPAALGTQTLGSVLRPAAFNGVVGFKPSFGAVPRTDVYAFAESLDHIGVFARSVDDVALVASVLFGNDGIDVPHIATPETPWPLAPFARPPRIAHLATAVDGRMSAAQHALMDATAAKLVAAGAVVTPFTLPPAFDAIWSAAATIADVEGAVVNARWAAESPPRVGQATLDLVARGSTIPAVDYVRAKQTQRALIVAFASLMAPFDAALLPPAIGEAPAGLADTGDAIFCTPGSLFGAPAVALPAGVGPTGLPLGIQLVAPWGRDRLLLETARWVADALGHPVTIAPVVS
jgi:Asp-tRNA(Asn)/Glu-tRNA(Gln) amidotransferase A subunit family amidase